ncbi:MAG: aminotransferase class V-fold PLP-dependent enzyme [Planctomycetota bacterium]
MASRAIPQAAPVAERFRLDPSIVYLNHGSFGACPIEVCDAQAGHRDRVEADAVRFYVHDLWSLMDRSRRALAPIAGCDGRDLVFVPNATTGVTTVLSNLDLRRGDEVLTTAHEYTACLNNARSHAGRSGASVVVADLSWPVPSEQTIYDNVMSRVTDRTRVALISLITSATAVRLPVEQLIADLDDRGIDTILDAAHGPGCVQLDIEEWGAAWTTGNCHKWLFAPKGAAFLRVRPDKQDGFRPMVLSNDAERLDTASARTRRPAWHHEFDYCGTDDATAKLAIADAAHFAERLLPGGIHALMQHNRAMCLRARDTVCDTLGVDAPVPDAMLGPMAAIELPESAPDAQIVKNILYEDWRIQIPVWDTPSGRTVTRLSAQVYNTDEQFVYLGEALKSIVA